MAIENCNTEIKKLGRIVKEADDLAATDTESRIKRPKVFFFFGRIKLCRYEVVLLV